MVCYSLTLFFDSIVTKALPGKIMLDAVMVNVYSRYMVAQVQTGYSTGQVASIIGVAKKTLLRWMAAGELPEPNTIKLGEIGYRIWSEDDLQRAKQFRESSYRQKRP